MFLPYMIASFALNITRRINDSEHPNKEALAMGREVAKITKGIMERERP